MRKPDLPTNEDANAYVRKTQRITQKMCSRAAQPADRDDLFGAAMLGLAESIKRYDSNRQADFWSYARHRIVGAVRDELRRQDTLTRGERALARRLLRQANSSAQRRKKNTTLHEAAADAGVDSDLVENLRSALRRRWAKSLDGGQVQVACLDAQPDERCHSARMRRAVLHNINRLPARHRDVVRMLYFDDMTTVEAAQKLGVSQGRISQIRSEMLGMMRELMAPLAAAA